MVRIDDEILNLKHIADNEMLKELESYNPTSIMDRFHKWIVVKLLSLKVKFGMALA